MKLTLSWLKDHLETEASLDQIVTVLTRVGLEVEAVEDRGPRSRPSPSRASSRRSSIRMPTGFASASSTPAGAIGCRSCAVRRTPAPG